MRKFGVMPLLAFGASAALIAAATLSVSAETPVMTPAPKAAAPQSHAAQETIVLAGGCFWGVQAVFQHVQGVKSAVSGYAGGKVATPSYEQVSTGTTGHAESVSVTFDPQKVASGEILRIYFSVAHDPTQLNRQGPDEGTQYRSEIFASDPAEAEFAKAYIAELERGQGVRPADRDQGRDRRVVLPGRGLSPGLRDAAPGRALHRLQRRAQGREPQAPVPGAVSRAAASGRGRLRPLILPRRPRRFSRPA